MFFHSIFPEPLLTNLTEIVYYTTRAESLRWRAVQGSQISAHVVYTIFHHTSIENSTFDACEAGRKSIFLL